MLGIDSLLELRMLVIATIKISSLSEIRAFNMFVLLLKMFSLDLLFL